MRGWQKIMCCCLFYLAAVCRSAAQEAAIDSNFRPERYDVECEQFRYFRPSKKDIVMIGNSITAYISWPELLRNKHIRNRGIAGDHTFGLLARISDVTAGQPQKIMVLIGINDLSRNFPEAMIIANCRRVIAAVRSGSPRTGIYFQSVLPVNTSFSKAGRHYNKGKEIISLNAALKDLCVRERVTFIDLYAAFTDEAGRLRPAFTYDGVHLSLQGYVQWASVIRPYLKRKQKHKQDKY